MLRNSVATAMPAATLFPLTFQSLIFFPQSLRGVNKNKNGKLHGKIQIVKEVSSALYSFTGSENRESREKRAKNKKERNAVNENQTPAEAPDQLDRDRTGSLPDGR